MKKDRLFYRIIRTIIKPLIKLFFPYEIKGEENLSKINGGYVLCSNHLSNIDPIFLIISNNRIIRFMAKAELFKNKILSYIFLSMGAFSVERGKGDKKAILIAENILKSDEVLGIFIEGTRSKTGEFLKPKSGAVLLAYKAQVPIIPVCITGENSNHKVKFMKKTTISYGAPVYLNKICESQELNTSAIRKMSGLIMERIKEMRYS